MHVEKMEDGWMERNLMLNLGRKASPDSYGCGADRGAILVRKEGGNGSGGGIWRNM